jgi:hypothetical protein
MKRALYLTWFLGNAKRYLAIKLDRCAPWTDRRFYGKMDCFLKNIRFNQRPIAA